MFFVFVRPRPPSLRWAIDDHEMQGITTLPQFVSLWERKMLDFWCDLTFRDRLHHTAAPECFLAPIPPPPAVPTITADPDANPKKKPGKPNPKDANKDRVGRAQKPIIRWKATVPHSSRTAKDLFGVISDKRIVSQPHFPGATLVRDSTKTTSAFA
jgi:hypothetical protein